MPISADFVQPAIYPAEQEIWPPGSCSEIIWLHWKGDPQIPQPSSKRPFIFDPENYYYNIDLIANSGEESEVVRKVMRESRFLSTLFHLPSPMTLADVALLMLT